MNRHIPVLLQETIEYLNLVPGKNVIDGTLGDAGHAEAILEKTSPSGKLLGVDADAESILRAKKFLYKYDERVTFARDNFENIKAIVADAAFDDVDGILLDLGWSTPQFQERGRGFSFLNSDEPLDMRYDTYLRCPHMTEEPPLSYDGKPLYGPCTAAEIVNTMDEADLSEIFKKYGEEKLHKEIAAGILEKRNVFTLETVGDLVDIILDVYRTKLKTDKEVPWIGGLHPATKVFQALRILVNDELGVVERVIPDAIDVLKSGGRLAIISFHSLEDRIVKHTFKELAKKKVGTIITKKPVVCGKEEYDNNPPSRSAKLRVIQKIKSDSNLLIHPNYTNRIRNIRMTFVD